MEPAQLRDFAERYTTAWCSGDPARVAAFYSPNGSLSVNAAAAVGRSAIISFENAGYWKTRGRSLRGGGAGTTLVSGQPRVRSITLLQFDEVLHHLGLRTKECVLLCGSEPVRWWVSLFADAAVFRVAKG